jgi:hypothetical protein
MCHAELAARPPRNPLRAIVLFGIRPITASHAVAARIRHYRFTLVHRAAIRTNAHSFVRIARHAACSVTPLSGS